MNIAHNKNYAAASANFCGRYAFARRFGVAGALACALAGVAHAGAGERDGGGRGGAQALERQGAREAMRAERQQQAQLQQAPQQQVQQQQVQQQQAQAPQQQAQDQSGRGIEAFRRSGRLTPDERRDLRRQINEAGLDIYPNTPRR